MLHSLNLDFFRPLDAHVSGAHTFFTDKAFLLITAGRIITETQQVITPVIGMKWGWEGEAIFSSNLVPGL